MLQTLLKRYTEINSQTPPAGSLPFYCASRRCGVVVPQSLATLKRLRTQDPRLQRLDVTDAAVSLNCAPDEASGLLQQTARALSEHGALTAWRDEELDVIDLDGTGTEPAVFARCERALYRFFGMKTRSVYALGVTTDGRFISGKRSATKAIDPGLWDTLAAGLIAANEPEKISLMRELQEEAGLSAVSDVSFLDQPFGFTVHRAVPEGWLHEEARVFSCLVDDLQRIHNTDGEVEEFKIFTRDEVLALIDAGQFPADTALAYLMSEEIRA